MSESSEFAELVGASEARIAAYDPDAVAAQAPPSTLRFEKTPDGAAGFRAIISPGTWTHGEKLSLRLLAFVLTVLVLVNAAFALTGGKSVLLGFAAMMMWLVAGAVALHLRTMRASVEIVVDADGFTVIRHFAWRAIGERADRGGRGLMSERFDKQELRAIAVIISDLATDDDETSFDLLVTRVTSQGQRVRDHIVRSRRREEVEWMAARLRGAMAVPIHLPDRERFEATPRWPRSVLRKVAEGKSKNWEY